MCEAHNYDVVPGFLFHIFELKLLGAEEVWKFPFPIRATRDRGSSESIRSFCYDD